MSLDNEISKIQLTEEQLEELERLSALGYHADQMAQYFLINAELFSQVAQDPHSDINYHIQRGKLVSRAKEEMALLQNAEGGNVTAIQQLDKIRRSRNFETQRDDFLFGPDHDDAEMLAKLESYINDGSLRDLSNDEALYFEILTIFNTVRRRFGKRKTIQFFTKPPFNFSVSRARLMFDESINFFYSNSNVDRMALRHMKAEQIEEAAHLLLQNAKSAKDFDIYKNMQLAAADLHGLNEDVKEPLPKAYYLKPIKYYGLDPKQVGLGEINRNDVAQQIDALDIPERDKQRVKGDAYLQTIELAEVLDELSQEDQQ